MENTMTDTSLNSASINPTRKPGAAPRQAWQRAIERLATSWRKRASRHAALRLLEVADRYEAQQPSFAQELRAAANARLCAPASPTSEPLGAALRRCRSSSYSGSAPCRKPA